jgi:pimeloyl-ACP methyl ester carboxylesterase
LCAGGCSYFSNQVTPSRLQNGYTIILPGVEGLSFANSNLAQGLKNSGYDGAIEIDNWTTGSFLLLPIHLRDINRNRREAWRIAQKIVSYQNRYPGRPVHLIGHSGGGGIALMTLEALPSGRQVTTATLLHAAVSPGYNLTDALAGTELGIWNYYSPLDLFVLGAGTSLAGTVDGHHTPAAGLVGFREPIDSAAAFPFMSRTVEHDKLHQVQYHWSMLASGNLGGHLGSTWLGFSKNHLAPVLAEADRHRDPRRMWSAAVRVSSPAREPAIPAQSDSAPGIRWIDFVGAPQANNPARHEPNVVEPPGSSTTFAPIAPGRTD